MFFLLIVIAACASLPFFFSRMLERKKRGGESIIEIGQVFIWIVFLYACFPLIGMWLTLSGVGQIAESRLRGDPPDYLNVLEVGVSYFLFMCGFSFTYLKARKFQLVVGDVSAQKASWGDLQFSLVILILIKVTLFGIYGLYGGNTGDDYISSYTALRGQSIIVQQIANIATSAELAATLLVFATALAYNLRFIRLIYVFIILQVLFAVFSGGGRTFAFLTAFGFFIIRPFYVKSKQNTAVYAVVGLFLFLIAGLIRSDVDLDSGTLNLELFQHGEFVAVFCNSLDLLDKLTDISISQIKVALYAVDFLRFIPQQIIGDVKLDPAVFYVSTFYPEYYEAGGGFAFGAIAESIIGFGPVEALIRGTLLGIAYAFIANKCIEQKSKVLQIFIYSWFVVVSYQAIRDTTFTVFPRFFFQVLPLLIFIKFSGAFKSRIFQTASKHIVSHGDVK